MVGIWYIIIIGLKILLVRWKVIFVIMFIMMCVFIVMVWSGLNMNDNVINNIMVIDIGCIILCYNVNL